MLNNGRSEKDLDLYFLPLTPCKGTPDDLKKWLDGLWGGGEDLVNTGGRLAICEVPEYPDDPMYHAKLKYSYSGLRIDVFIMGNGEVKNERS